MAELKEADFDTVRRGDVVRVRFLYRKDSQYHFVELTGSIMERSSHTLALGRCKDVKTELPDDYAFSFQRMGVNVDRQRVRCLWKEEA